jgi:hypothetical protein
MFKNIKKKTNLKKIHEIIETYTDTATLPTADMMVELNMVGIQKLADMGPEAKQSLLDYLENPPESKRYRQNKELVNKGFIALALAKMGDTSMINEILANLDKYEKVYGIRETLIKGFAEQGENIVDRVIEVAGTDSIGGNRAIAILGFIPGKKSLEFLRTLLLPVPKNIRGDRPGAALGALNHRSDETSAILAREVIKAWTEKSSSYAADRLMNVLFNSGTLQGLMGFCDIINLEMDERTSSVGDMMYGAWATWFSAIAGTTNKAIEQLAAMASAGIPVDDDYVIKSLIRVLALPGSASSAKTAADVLMKAGKKALPFVQKAMEDPHSVWSVDNDPSKELYYDLFPNETLDPVELCKEIIEAIG